MNSRSFPGLIILIGALLLLSISCGDDDTTVNSDGPAPAALAIEPASLDFGVETTQMTLIVTNTGGSTLTWSCTCDSNLVSFAPTTGSETTGADTIYVDANRAGLVVGDHFDTLMFTSTGGSATVPVVVSVGLTPLPPLIGDYEGIYAYVTDYGEGSQVTNEYPIRWRFSNANYWMYDDGEDPPVLCEPSGTYVLTGDVVELTQISSGCGYSIIDPAMTPVGEFTVRQPTDSLIMFQIDSENNIFSELRLVPATD